MRKNSGVVTGAMAYKRFLCKYYIIENVFTVTTVSVDNLKARLYSTESLLHSEPVVTQRCECSRKVTTILPMKLVKKGASWPQYAQKL